MNNVSASFLLYRKTVVSSNESVILLKYPAPTNFWNCVDMSTTFSAAMVTDTSSPSKTTRSRRFVESVGRGRRDCNGDKSCKSSRECTERRIFQFLNHGRRSGCVTKSSRRRVDAKHVPHSPRAWSPSDAAFHSLQTNRRDLCCRIYKKIVGRISGRRNGMVEG